MEQNTKTSGWSRYIIAIGLLMAFAFYVNRGIEIKGLYMDDLYLWSCYGEQSFMEYVFPLGSTRFRFIYYLASYLELALVGTHINWLVPINIILNGLIAGTIYHMGRRLSHSDVAGFLAGIMYLLSRMSYYQISQVYGLMETMALWCAIGILYCLFQYLNKSKNENPYFLLANLLYFTVCFIHERYMVLLPVFFLVLLMKRQKKVNMWLLPAMIFVLVQAIRFLTIGTLSPAGTGGTDVADTFHVSDAIGYALSQVAYVFGINAGPEHLNGLSWTDTPQNIRYLVLAADVMLILLVLFFIIKLIRNRRIRWNGIQNTLLFFVFIALCIGSSSVTVRVELRWIYVSLTAALLYLCYIIGTLKQCDPEAVPAGKAVPYAALFMAYILLMIPAEGFYRSQYPNIYLSPNQSRYNSLADETYGRYGDKIFGRTIYIIGNTYEMSDFTARTFFKAYDKDRKAEGTKVIFIDSIRDVGQITEDMLILREDPSHNAFQDITDYVKSLKCSSPYGYYSDGWMDEKASLRIMSGATGQIELECYYPSPLTGTEEVKVTIGGKETRTIPVTDQSFSITLDTDAYQTIDIIFENNFYAQDADEQRGETRMSMVVKVITD